MTAATLAHAPEWADVIRHAYGHDPLRLSAEDEAGHAGMLPAVIVRRPLGGVVVASMPFLDGGGPCGDTPDIARHLIEGLTREARRLGARYIDLRCSERLDVPWAPFEHKVNMVLALPRDPDALWKRLDPAVRNKVRKAERGGLAVEDAGRDGLGEFYDIFASRMRDLGSPVHAQEFFRATLDAFGDRARLVLVRKGSKAIGGLIALVHHNTITVPWSSSLQDCFQLSPNILLYWETIRRACQDGVEHFDFGRSTRGSGTYHFKRHWGATEHPLFWYQVPLAQLEGTRPEHPQSLNDPASSSSAHALTGLWRRLPLAFTRQVGPHIRKYLVQ